MIAYGPSNDMLEMLRILKKHRVEFLIVGGHAVNAYTEPRATKDLDIWLNPTIDNANRVYAALQEFGAPLTSFRPEDFTDQ